jgi:hypothetical protein
MHASSENKALGRPSGLKSDLPDLEVDMSKPSLRLINCSGGQPPLSRRKRRRAFRPFVIQGGAGTTHLQAMSDDSLFRLLDSPVQISYQSYLTLLLLNLTVFLWSLPRHIEPTGTALLIVNLTELVGRNPNSSDEESDTVPANPDS